MRLHLLLPIIVLIIIIDINLLSFQIHFSTNNTL